MTMNLDLFRQMLEFESTSGTERRFAEFIEKNIHADKNIRYEVGDGTLNLMFSWGEPKVVFCTHMDTVPPYIPPVFKDIKAGEILPDGVVLDKDDVLILGRGSCDAKGQIFSMLSACLKMASEGKKGFALLLLSGEETGSFGAKAYTCDCSGGDWLIVGEPTDNMMVSASKGTKSFLVRIHGKACHSGYPERGESAVNKFVDFFNDLRHIDFPLDDILGPTTWNIGKLSSDNPQNILSPELSFRLYFRTTPASDSLVQELIMSMASEDIEIESFGGDTPMRYMTLNGFGTKPVSFGSDTPRMTKFRNRALCGPGSIFTAHTSYEYVLLSQLEAAVKQYELMYDMIINRVCKLPNAQ